MNNFYRFTTVLLKTEPQSLHIKLEPYTSSGFDFKQLLGVVNLIEMKTIDEKIKRQNGNELWKSDYDYSILKHLIHRAIAEGKDQEFIDILEREPEFPLNHCDFNVPEFGKKVEAYW